LVGYRGLGTDESQAQQAQVFITNASIEEKNGTSVLTRNTDLNDYTVEVQYTEC
jgi:hypothetical protein